MIINNKIDKVFGPSGVFAGYVLMTVGLISSFYYPTALILLVIGGYTAFTTSGTIIDTDKKRIKHYISHFGLLKSGKWLELESFTGIQISRSNISYSTFSRSNRQLDTKKKGYVTFEDCCKNPTVVKELRADWNELLDSLGKKGARHITVADLPDLTP